MAMARSRTLILALFLAVASTVSAQRSLWDEIMARHQRVHDLIWGPRGMGGTHEGVLAGHRTRHADVVGIDEDRDYLVRGELSEEELQEPACACSQTDKSGTVEVSFVGCGRHLYPLELDEFCYVTDPEGCPGAVRSARSPGAKWRICSPSSDSEEYDSVYAAVESSPELSLLKAALDRSMLAEMLANVTNTSSTSSNSSSSNSTISDSKITLVAPSNAAFRNAVAAAGLSSVDELVASRFLTPILLQHALLGSITREEVEKAEDQRVEAVTLSPQVFNEVTLQVVDTPGLFPGTSSNLGKTLRIREPVISPPSGLSLGLSSGTFVQQEMVAKNGVVLIVDSILALTPSIPQLLEDSEGFRTFWLALEKANATDLVGGSDCPDETGECVSAPVVSVLAPTDAAFARLAIELNTTVDALLEDPDLENLVKMHISDEVLCTASGNLADEKVNQSTPVPTLLRGQDVVSRTDVRGRTMLSTTPEQKRNARVVGSRSAYNGCLLAINDVLVPTKNASSSSSSGINTTTTANSTKSNSTEN